MARLMLTIATKIEIIAKYQSVFLSLPPLMDQITRKQSKGTMAAIPPPMYAIDPTVVSGIPNVKNFITERKIWTFKSKMNSSAILVNDIWFVFEIALNKNMKTKGIKNLPYWLSVRIKLLLFKKELRKKVKEKRAKDISMILFLTLSNLKGLYLIAASIVNASKRILYGFSTNLPGYAANPE